MTVLRLAWMDLGERANRAAFTKPTDARYERPAMLVSQLYFRGFDKARSYVAFRDYSLDSGAFSAWTQNIRIDLGTYIDTCRTLLADDIQCAEVFALDVIGDWRAGLRNTERMWSAGVPAVPTYHVGEPEHVLRHLATTYPKIALGGAVGMPPAGKLAWARQCFARVWPKPIHGLGFSHPRHLFALPWHSVDATNWGTTPVRFGHWRIAREARINTDVGTIRPEVEWYLRLEAEVKARWRNEMKLLDEIYTGTTSKGSVST